jgi:hypothetical protein
LLDTEKHFIKYWPTWYFGGLFFHKDINDINCSLTLTLLVRPVGPKCFSLADLLSSVDLRVYMKNFSGVIIHKIVLANEEPRGAWRTLSDSGFFGGNSEQTALRADRIFASDSDFQFWRCLLDKVRNYFEQNPND